jgi:hypothetical protein
MKNNREIKGQNVINVNVSDPSRSETKGLPKYLSVFKDGFLFIVNASNKSIIKFFGTLMLTIILIVGGKFLYSAAGSEKVMEAISRVIDSKNEQIEENGIEIRQDVVTPEIQKELKLLCYTLNADRVFLFELHNGRKSAGGLPFVYADMSYEEVNIEKCLEYVGTEFQNIPLTLYKYPHYLFHKRYEYETVSGIAEIDNAFAKHINDIGGKYLASIYITIHGKPLAFLCASFHTEPVLTEEIIKSKMENSARILKPLLDLETQLKNVK